MDVVAHALWAGAGVMLARRRCAITPRTATATVALAALPDIPHLLPVVGWSAFGAGTAATVGGYTLAGPGQEPALPPWVEWLSHNLHCVAHSAIVAGVLTLLLWLWTRSLWIPLLGWWSHIVVDVFTHSAEYYPSPAFWPITREGFDGWAWNTPGFMAVNYAALAATYWWLGRRRRRERESART
ncbi:MAG: hypothetical protein J0L57_00480 [Burkholderiales bacterium]|jgi:hypothetical protein|nr:hypothetical protein [Burkholderiales bacterium]MCU0937631.1 metal-dependent hydrolase [Burkholderiaceae bacterium]